MDFLTSTALATTQLRNRPLADHVADQTALLLVGHAARHLAAHDPAWSVLALAVLDVTAELYPTPDPVVLDVDPPAGDDAATRRAVEGLLQVLADRYDQASGIASDTTRALNLRAAAIRLRDETVQLT